MRRILHSKLLFRFVPWVVVPLVAGCTIHPFIVHPFVIQLPWSDGTLTSADQTVLTAIGFQGGVSFQEQQSPGGFTTQALSMPRPVAYGTSRTTQDLATLTAYTIDQFYAGPFPATAESLPGSDAPRATGDWLTTNPQITDTCTQTTKETYWTPGGAMTDPPAYTELVIQKNDASEGPVDDDRNLQNQGDAEDDGNGHKVLTDLYQDAGAAAGLPAYFAAKLTLPSIYQVNQAQETYRSYHAGSVAGTALGFRWDVTAGTNQPLAYIRATQVTAPDGSKIDRYVLDANYQTIDGVTRPARYGYQTYYEATGIGELFDQTYDASTGNWTGQGLYKDLHKGVQVTFTETIQPDHEVERIYTYVDGSTTVVTTEHYRPDGSGDGAAELDGSQDATTDWDRSGHGTIHFAHGHRDFSASLHADKGALKPPC